jgi:hypothetical protein
MTKYEYFYFNYKLAIDHHLWAKTKQDKIEKAEIGYYRLKQPRKSNEN